MCFAQLKPFVIAVAALLSISLGGCANMRGGGENAEPLRVRVMAYNIHHCLGIDGELDVERIAGVINAANPDLVTLQEVDNRTERSDRVDQAAELGRLTGMHARFGRAIDHQGGEYGQAILSRWPI